ncbi:MAG: tetratricopeptide repeat protein [bacterium]
MKRASILFVAATLVGGYTRANAQANAQANAPAKWADTISTEIEKAQMAGDDAKLAAAVALANRVATAFPTDGLILHYQGYAIYRQGLLQMGRGGDASALFEQARGILERSLKARPLPETHGLLSSIDGQLIAKSPNRAMELGMASQASQSAALSIGPKSPRVWLLRGQGAIFTPPEYGGGLSVAEGQLKHAIELFASDAPKPGEPSWGKAEAYAWLGQVYEKQGDKAKAASFYKQAIDIAPNYGYAKMLSSALK